MSLQGNLRDFHVSEILQLLGLQSKTGCLVLQGREGQARFYVLEGRVVSARAPGDISLLAFLRRVQRLTEEQVRGIRALQSETRRDVEDIILQGRYMHPENLAECLERHFIEELWRVAHWNDGTYQFQVNEKWPYPPTTRAAVEGLLMEVARRSDEWTRYQEVLPDDHVVLGLRDLPDPEEPFSDEERDLFGLIDGRRTLAEVAASAALTRFELYESLHRMIESGWVEVIGRREPEAGTAAITDGPPAGVEPAPPRKAGRLAGRAARSRTMRRFIEQLREAVVILVVAVAVAALARLGRNLTERAQTPAQDVFVAAQLRDIRHALELFHRVEGHYPRRLQELVDGGWVPASQLRFPGMELSYKRADDDRYGLAIEAER